MSASPVAITSYVMAGRPITPCVLIVAGFTNALKYNHHAYERYKVLFFATVGNKCRIHNNFIEIIA